MLQIIQRWGCCGLSKAGEKKVSRELRLNSSIFSAPLPPLNVEGTVLTVILSILLVYATFSLSSSTPSCSLCLILHPLPSLCASSLVTTAFLHLFLPTWLPSAVTPGNSQILLFWMEPCCPWPELTLSYGSCLREVKECKVRHLLT